MEQHPGNIPGLSRSTTVAVRPDLNGSMPNFVAFCRDLGVELGRKDVSQRAEVLERGRRQIREEGAAGPLEQLVSRFARSVVVDMAAQGWALEATDEVRLTSPQLDLTKPEKVKEQIRQWHLLERDAQLQEKSVMEFVRRMEQPILYKGGWHSITSVMRDGSELAKALRPIVSLQNEQEREVALAGVIQPYLQLVESDVVCAHSGLKLTDIWRYFRHTWVNPYKSLPGRSMTVLIRDAAGPNHPVIGIGALGSSMAQQTQRDQWIGWDSEIFYQRLLEKPSRKLQAWLRVSLQRLIKSIYVEDFLRSRLVSPEQMRTPEARTIDRLIRASWKAG